MNNEEIYDLLDKRLSKIEEKQDANREEYLKEVTSLKLKSGWISSLISLFVTALISLFINGFDKNN